MTPPTPLTPQDAQRAPPPRGQTIGPMLTEPPTPNHGAHYATIERIDLQAPRGKYTGGYVVDTYRRALTPGQPPKHIRRIGLRFERATDAVDWLDTEYPTLAIRGYKAGSPTQ